MPLAIVSTLLTVRWMKRINPERFYVLIYALMVLLGAKLLWDGLAGYGATAAAKTRRLGAGGHRGPPLSKVLTMAKGQKKSNRETTKHKAHKHKKKTGRK